MLQEPSYESRENLRDKSDETDQKDVSLYLPSWPIHRIQGVIGAIPVDNVGVYCQINVRRWVVLLLQSLGIVRRADLEILGWDMVIVFSVRVAIHCLGT